MSDASNIDPVMLELFRAEVDIHLPALSSGLLALENDKADVKEIDSMMRAAHSIKGAARIVGNEPAVRVAHIMEDCFTLAKESRVKLSSESVDVLLEGVDALQRICDADADVTEEFIRSVLGRIATLRDGKPTPKGSADAPLKAPVGLPARSPPSTTAATAQSNIALPSNFDDEAAESVRVQLCEMLASEPVRVSMDFGQVSNLSVTAMSLLMSFARAAAEAVPTSIVQAHGLSPDIRVLFRVVGLDKLITVND